MSLSLATAAPVIRAKNQEMRRKQSAINRTMEALDVFAAVVVSRARHVGPEFAEEYRDMRRDHARRIVDAVIGLTREQGEQ